MPRRLVVALGVCLGLAGCATPMVSPPEPREVDPPIAVEAPAIPSSTPMIEHPPLEPVEPVEPVIIVEPPSVAAPAVAPPPTPSPTPAAGSTPPSVITSPPAPPPPVVEAPSEDQITVALLGDLAHYMALSLEDARKELVVVTQLLTRSRTDANRVRLAMLYTLMHTIPDDQRALQLLETVVRANSGLAGIRQLAGVLQVQVVERLRAVREEQQKAEIALQKLEALRQLERDLLRDRFRGGGGGGGGGSGGGSGGGR